MRGASCLVLLSVLLCFSIIEVASEGSDDVEVVQKTPKERITAERFVANVASRFEALGSAAVAKTKNPELMLVNDNGTKAENVTKTEPPADKPKGLYKLKRPEGAKPSAGISVNATHEQHKDLPRASAETNAQTHRVVSIVPEGSDANFSLRQLGASEGTNSEKLLNAQAVFYNRSLDAAKSPNIEPNDMRRSVLQSDPKEEQT